MNNLRGDLADISAATKALVCRYSMLGDFWERSLSSFPGGRLQPSMVSLSDSRVAMTGGYATVSSIYGTDPLFTRWGFDDVWILKR